MKNRQSCKEKYLQPVLSALLLSTLLLAQSVHATVVAKCNQFDIVNITPTSNTYKVYNDVVYSLNNSQCIKVDDANGNFNVITSTANFPTIGLPVNFVYIGKGCHWGYCTTKSGMPKQVSALLNVTSSWKTVQPATTATAKSAYDVSYNIWFNKTATASAQADGAQLMIWLASKGGVAPIGLKIASNQTISGSTWNIWKGLNNGIAIVTYVRTANVVSVANLNIKAFITDATTTRNIVQASWYLIGLEAGFEIWKTSEGLASSSFSALVE
ncbi:hypothetical protein [Crenothrix sp.]|uniref:GH12 family glycosyl hydrolase domain-containing protein n=1 Tax=Crenothrix sp. TaxID=3100433 RepID=UPI00374CA0B8